MDHDATRPDAAQAPNEDRPEPSIRVGLDRIEERLAELQRQSTAAYELVLLVVDAFIAGVVSRDEWEALAGNDRLTDDRIAELSGWLRGRLERPEAGR